MDDNGSYADDVIIVDQKHPVAGPSQVAVPRSESGPASTSIRNRAAPMNRLTSVKTNAVDVSTSAHEWSCPMCTLLNQPQTLQCEVCFAERPPDPIAGWTCMTCGESEMPPNIWSCQFCGAVKTTSW
jgi:hypothetical protein